MIGKLFVFLLLCCPALAGDRGMCVRGFQVVKGQPGEFTVLRIADFEDGSSAWLTAGHCVALGPMELIAPSQKYKAEVVADSIADDSSVTTSQVDVALIKGPHFTSRDHFRIVDKSPRRAAVYSLIGDREKFYEVSIRDEEGLWSDGKAERGESGAPLFVNNECYGLLTGFTSDKTECVIGADGFRRCRLVYRGGIRFQRSRTILKWLETTTYQPCVPNAGNPIQPIPQPEPQPQPVGSAGCDCEQQFAALRARVEQLESRKLVAGPAGPAGPRGEVGAQGPAGRAGTVTVILEDNGKQLHKQPDLLSGSTVRVPIRRIEKSSTGSN